MQLPSCAIVPDKVSFTGAPSLKSSQQNRSDNVQVVYNLWQLCPLRLFAQSTLYSKNGAKSTPVVWNGKKSRTNDLGILETMICLATWPISYRNCYWTTEGLWKLSKNHRWLYTNITTEHFVLALLQSSIEYRCPPMPVSFTQCIPCLL
jgi:hypothetical protein